MTACDSGLVYAPEGGYCVAFQIKLARDEILTEDIIGAFAASLEESINSGDLYQCVRKKYPDTLISGLGSPGDGVEYRSKPSLNEGNAAPDTEENSDGTGVSAGGVVGILLVLALPVVVWALYTRHSSSKDNSVRQTEIYVREYEQQDPEVPPQSSAHPLESATATEPASTAEGGETSKSGVDELDGKDDDSSSAESIVSESHIGDVNETFDSSYLGDVMNESIIEEGATPPRTAASSLAAMGAASAVVATGSGYW